MKKIIIMALMVMLISSCSLQTITYPKELALAKETEHAMIYVRKTEQDINAMVEIISSEFESQYKRITDMFQISPSEKAIIHIYTDKDQFRQMIGRDTEGTYDARDKIIKVIVQFIYEKYGKDKFNTIIREPDEIENILNKSIEDLYMEWKEYVNALY
ncbi:hypothetical protein RQP50_09425 [Paenibacillus sp. chi10]|uniref:Lipoprotein n=1 Tax=Paenibacillus suaedae TaxID=3077233 RepID=A0AAJ2JVI4_9BACL|nr:hypothetical protein [Paenibacillus sp. chi10]MDT8976459.1 hypothetical protein [Paenibacillus sp. chi10]